MWYVVQFKPGLPACVSSLHAPRIAEPQQRSWILLKVMIMDPSQRESLLVHLCQVEFQLGESVQQDALRLLEKTKQHLETSKGALSGNGVNDDSIGKCWIASILYCASKMNNDRAHAEGFTLTNLLHVLESQTVMIFFKVLGLFLKISDSILRSMYGDGFDTFQKTLKELQDNFIHVSVLYDMYVRYFGTFFAPNDINIQKSASSTTGPCDMSAYLRFGWMVFLSLRMYCPDQFVDLKTRANGLIAVFVLMAIHIPAHLRKASLEDTSTYGVRSSKGVNIISSLCHLLEAELKDITILVDKVNSMIQLIVGLNQTLPEQIAGIDTAGIMYFEGLMEESLVCHYTDILDDNYTEMYHKKGEIDERSFLPDVASPKRRRTMPAETRECMSAREWVFSVIFPLAAKPSPSLRSLFRFISKDMSKQVLSAARALLDQVFCAETIQRVFIGDSKEGLMLDSVWASQRKAETLKLYYKVLGNLSKAEAKGLSHHNLLGLLVNDRFHRCILACSAEVILATYMTVSVAFPAVLDQMAITAFDLCMVIESFVRLEESLPEELRRQLILMGEQLLRKLAWTPGSSLYYLLIIAKPHLKSEISKMGLLNPAISLDYLKRQLECLSGILQLTITLESLDGLHGLQLPWVPIFSSKENLISFMNPGGRSTMQDSVPATPCLNSSKALSWSLLQSECAACPQGQTLAREACAEIGIKIFFHKVLYVAAMRVKLLGEALKQPFHVARNVCNVFQHLLLHETHLFFNRHVDQNIICCLFGTCKVENIELTFREIVQSYCQLPQSGPDGFRDVLLDSIQGVQQRGDIIQYYQNVFVPSAKNYLMQWISSSAGSEEGVSADGQ